MLDGVRRGPCHADEVSPADLAKLDRQSRLPGITRRAFTFGNLPVPVPR